MKTALVDRHESYSPSGLFRTAVLFGSGRGFLEGHADFLSQPYLVNRAAPKPYRVYLDHTDVVVTHLSSGLRERPAEESRSAPER